MYFLKFILCEITQKRPILFLNSRHVSCALSQQVDAFFIDPVRATYVRQSCCFYALNLFWLSSDKHICSVGHICQLRTKSQKVTHHDCQKSNGQI